MFVKTKTLRNNIELFHNFGHLVANICIIFKPIIVSVKVKEALQSLS